MSSRRAARKVAFQLLYQNDTAKCDADETMEQMMLLMNDELDQEGKDYVNLIVRGTIEHRNDIDEILRSLSENWRFERIAVAEKNILRLAVYELLYRKDIPPRVTINEAINLAKRFGDEKSGAFVNGILDAVLQKRDAKELPEVS